MNPTLLSDDNSFGMLTRQASDSCYAYVSLFFGNRDDVFQGLMVLGFSLRVRKETKTNHALILLHAADVPSHFLAALRRFWELKPVEEINLEPNCFIPGMQSDRRRLLLKLHALELTMFTKVLFLDADLLVKCSLDALFDLEAPAGVEVNCEEVPLPIGTKIPSNRLLDEKSGRLISRINAGVLLLRPDLDAFKKLVEDALVGGCCYSYCPEEDLMTRFWLEKWTSLGLQNNLEMWRCYMVSAHIVSSAAIYHFSTRWAKPNWTTFYSNEPVEFFHMTKKWMQASQWEDPNDLLAKATFEWVKALHECSKLVAPNGGACRDEARQDCGCCLLRSNDDWWAPTLREDLPCAH